MVIVLSASKSATGGLLHLDPNHPSMLHQSYSDQARVLVELKMYCHWIASGKKTFHNNPNMDHYKHVEPPVKVPRIRPELLKIGDPDEPPSVTPYPLVVEIQDVLQCALVAPI